MSSQPGVVKSGWLLRQTKFLKNWKKSWVVLYFDGFLRHFENERGHVAEDAILMSRECKSIKVGTDVINVVPPDKKMRSQLLSIETSSKTWNFCGESCDDTVAWQIAFEQARTAQLATPARPVPPRYTPYDGFGDPRYGTSVTQFTHNGAPVPLPYASYQYPAQHPGQPYVIRSADGQQTTVIYPAERDRCYNHRPGMGTGLMAGALVGSMMWGPLLWW